jgi:hypothetical protein
MLNVLPTSPSSQFDHTGNIGYIVQFMKAQRIRWLGHVERKSEEEMPKRMLKGRLFSRRKGRPHTRWPDNVVTDFVVMGVIRWRQCVEDRVGWRRVVKEAKAHQGPKC